MRCPCFHLNWRDLETDLFQEAQRVKEFHRTKNKTLGWACLDSFCEHVFVLDQGGTK